MRAPLRVAINGFGRIGRQVLRQMAGRTDVAVVAVNNARGSPSTAAHLFKYDSIYGRYPGAVMHDEQHLIVEGIPIRVLRQPQPLLCPWHALEVDVVVEATGLFTERDACADHLKAGASKVLITAPARDADLTVVVGVNDGRYDAEAMHIVSAASCTTTAWRRWRRCYTSSSASSAGCSPPSTRSPATRRSTTPFTRIRGEGGRPA